MAKVLKTIEVTDEFLKGCNNYQSMFTGISLTSEQMLEVFEWSPRGNGEYLLLMALAGFETGEREMFMDRLAEKLIGVDWPCGMDSEDSKYKDFTPRLHKAAREAGYQVGE